MEVEVKGTVASECEVSKAGHSDIEGFKRARVENLVSIMRETPSRATPVDTFQPQVVNGCKKRKFYQPQQHETKYNNCARETTRSPAEDNCQSGAQLGEEWKVKVSEMQLQIATIQRKLIDLYNVQSSNCEYSPKTIHNQNRSVYPSMAIEPLIGSTAAACNIDSITCSDWECLADNLKAGMSTLIDDWVRRHETSMQANDQTPPKSLIPKVSSTSCKPTPVTPYYSSRFLDSHSNRLPVFPPTYGHLSRPSTPVCSSHDGDDGGPISLVMSPKKRRVKVTDKVAIRTLNRYADISNDCTSSDSTVPSTLSTSVAIPNPSLTVSGLHLRAVDVVRNVSPDSSPFKSEMSDYFQDNVTYTSTLTPRHLRKAKLMFFYVRYPSSSILKDNFPDIKFNKSNTAQLVKWFSNFREFYYIQMEKYARQALNDGCKSADDVTVGVDSEIYRVLSLHYNRNSHIKVPPNFRFVVEQTLKEFFSAIATGRNNEPSWKKVIYKIIARLDDNLPEIFKMSNFLEQLE